MKINDIRLGMTVYCCNSNCKGHEVRLIDRINNEVHVTAPDATSVYATIFDPKDLDTHPKH